MLQKLHDAPNILRSRGLLVEVLPNFESTARSDDTSSYANGRPTHFVHHHTATSVTAHDNHTGSGSCQSEARSLQLAEPNEPTSNFGLCPHGVWFCICAGPSNTNGVGSDWWHPVGDPLRVPDNSMNSYAMANEMMNNGVGEPYPDVMIHSLLVGTAALCLAYGVGVFENRAHFEWAPSRKIDPAGPCKYMNLHDPSKRWNMGMFRTDIHAEMMRQLLPLIPPGEVMEDMVLVDCTPGWFLWNKVTGWVSSVPPVPAGANLTVFKDNLVRMGFAFEVLGNAALPLMTKLENETKNA